MPIISWIRSFFVSALIFGGWFLMALGQSPTNRVVRPVSELDVVTLVGNTHPMARPEFDQGPVNPETQLDHMVLYLTPSAEQQSDLDALVTAQHEPGSPLYHKWLTPSQYGSRFGVSAPDISQVIAWLRGHGFQVDEIPAGNRLIVFSGTAGQVSDAFHTEIRRYNANGVDHIANSQDPQIPRALADVVSGVVSLHDFRRNSTIATRRLVIASSSTETNPLYTSGSTNYLYPADWAAIYDLKSLYSAGTTGAGTSIAIVGRSNINISDVAKFRQTSGLSANNPTVILVSTNPGLVSGDQDESTLDVEWSGGIASGAMVKFVVGASTGTSDGVDLSAQYIVNHATAPIVSTSYGSCEQDMGATELAFYNNLWQQAASQGMSAFVSSGDSGAAGCYSGDDSSASGTGVNGLCSSPYSTCVGGTEFNEGGNNAKYWGTTNPTNEESALSYIPEVVWNESGSNGGSGLWASTGGVSRIYSQPSWQLGVPGTGAADGMRAVPDIAMDAAGHDAYMIVENGSSWTISGTSAASPSFAGVMALLVQAKGGQGQGNANPGLYSLLGAAHNPFHATPSGNNSVPGVTGFTASGAEYNLATGLGSVDGGVLVSSWGSGNASAAVDFVLKPSATSGTVPTGKTTTFTLNVTESGSAKNAVALKATAPSGVTVSFSPTSIVSGATATVTIAVASTAVAGTQNLTITGSDASGAQTVTYALTVTQTPTLALAAAANSIALVQGTQGTVIFTATPGGSFSGNIGLAIGGLPAGVNAAWSANPMATGANEAKVSSTLTLTASSTATVGAATITVSATGDGLVASQSVTLQVQQAAGVSLAASPTSISMESMATATVKVVATPFGGVAVPSGAAGSSISITSGLPKGITATWSAPTVTGSGTVAWTLTLAGSSSVTAGSSILDLTARVTAKTGAVYSASQNIPMTVILTPPTLSLSPTFTSLAVVRNASLTDVVSLTRNATFTGTVSLSVSGLPNGVVASWSSNPVALSAETGSSTLTLAATSSAAGGSSTITLTAVGDGLAVTQKLALTVLVPAPTLAIGAVSSSMTVINPLEATNAAQSSASQIFTFTGGGSFTGPVSLSVSGLPANLTASWSSNPITLGASESSSSTLTLTAKETSQSGSIATVAPGTYSITVTATGDGLTIVKSIQVEVAGILVTPLLSSITIHRGASGVLAVTTTPMGGASGVVKLALSENAALSGVSVQASPASIAAPGSGTTTFTFAVSSTATLRSYQLALSASMFANSNSSTAMLTGSSPGVVTLNIIQ
jgi:subtilase family serine protease